VTQPAHDNPVWKFLDEIATKKGITEIVINSPKSVFVERDGKFIQLNVGFEKNEVITFIQEIAKFNQKSCDADNPILDGNLPDGSRINVIVEPFSTGNPAITIRRYLRNIKTFASSPGVFCLFDQWIEFFKSAVKARCNIVVAGGTGVGKTTFLNLLLQEIPHDERVITIEDTRELNFDHPNLVRLEAARKNLASDKLVSLRDLVKNTLRMRPDRIIIGEVRGGELFDLLQAMNTGHDGSMTSIHASSTGECIQRMETLFLLAGFDVPHKVVRQMISTAVDFIVQLSRSKDGKRIVAEIIELTGMDGDTILHQTIASFDADDGGLKMADVAPQCLAKLHEQGGLPLAFFQG